MTTSTPTPMSFDQAIIDILTNSGPMVVADLRRALGVRRQKLLQALVRLAVSGQIKKGHLDKEGNDNRRRRVTTYAAMGKGSGGGSRVPDGGSRDQDQPLIGSTDAAADAEFANAAACPGCSEPWPGQGWCGSCSSTPGWHP